VSVATTSADRNPAFGLEQHGFDYIPEAERKMTLRDLAYVWVGTNAYLFFFSVGVIAFSLGLNVWQALVAVASATRCSRTSRSRRSPGCARACRP